MKTNGSRKKTNHRPVKPTAFQRSDRLLQEYAAESETQSVRFTFFHPEAREVFLAGTFNNWEPKSIPLSRQPDGRWAAEIMLNLGRYEYRFIVDGCWREDPMSAHYAANPFGGLNSVLEVKPLD